MQIREDLSMKMPSIKPTVSNEKTNSIFLLLSSRARTEYILLQALRFYGSYNVTVTGITIQNSPQCHLKFDNCEAVHVFNMSVTSPGDSLNTDGIHLQNSKDVAIHHCNLSCGNPIAFLDNNVTSNFQCIILVGCHFCFTVHLPTYKMK